MENASKALIIAGAILLSLLIITLGIGVVRSTSSTINRANVNQQEVQTFNEPFEAYGGNNKTMTDVRSLFSTVISNNGAQVQNQTTHFVSQATAAITTQPDAASESPTIVIPSNLVSGHSYTITFGYDKQGYVTQFAVLDNATSKYLGAE